MTNHQNHCNAFVEAVKMLRGNGMRPNSLMALYIVSSKLLFLLKACKAGAEVRIHHPDGTVEVWDPGFYS